MTANMEISTTVGCKMQCGYCPQKLHVKKYTEKSRETVMSLETFSICLEKIPNTTQIIFAGMAEPFLNPLCIDMIMISSLKGYSIGIYTTLVGLSSEIALRLFKINQYIGKFLFLTIHLPDDAGVMKMEVTDEYLDILKEAIKIPHNLMCIGNVHPKVRAVVGDVEDGSKGLLSRAGNLKSLAIGRKQGRLSCPACGPKLDHNILLPNGEILMCCMDYSQQHVIGNLLTDSYDDLFRSKEYNRIMQGLEDDGLDILCRKCEISHAE